MTPVDPLPLWLAPLWLAFWIGVSIAFRASRGKQLYPRRPVGALYSESWDSGRSLDTLWGRIGGASNCLMISVTKDRLVVVPRFPFNLMFLPEIYGLEVSAPLSQVSVEKPASGILKRGVVLSIGPVSEAKRMELRPRDRLAFLTAVGA